MRRAGARTEGKEGPFVPGMGAGTLAIDADANTDLTAGEKHGHCGARRRTRRWRTRVVPIDSAVRMPEGATFAEACTLPMNG